MILLVGPSAVGKTEVGKILQYQYGYEKLVTYTTRPARDKEIDGVDYHFVSIPKFLELQSDDFFFESVYYSANYYGTSLKDISKEKYVIVDPNGLKHYKESGVCCVSFYLDATKETRLFRMKKRMDNKEEIEKRIELDEKHFSKEIQKYCDHVIQVDNLTPNEIAKKINSLYRNENK